ncbi:MAG: SAM-dependent methyltransferase [Proteobacteria bacterium]|nr:SAM-dependent methyltransferase [Pseudomonadota bacterium]
MNPANSTNLPAANDIEQQHEALLKTHIIDVMQRHGGTISFAEFMQLALYAPGLGYYTAGKIKFGESGDFVTAPEISPLFGQCLAQQCADALDMLGSGDLLEAGAGSGKLACELLARLEQLDSLPEHYYILEVSADLRQQQQRHIAQTLPQLKDRVHWLDSLPKRFNGVIIGNEVLDAMPVERFVVTDDTIEQLHVGHEQGHFVWRRRKAGNALADRVSALELSPPYISELNLNAEAWIASLADVLERGLILLIDYGFPEHEYYLDDRREGTLMCHYKHHSHDNPLVLTGLQDITAHVDFTAIAQTAVDNNLAVSGYTSQAAFLIGCGLEQLASDLDSEDEKTRLNIAQQIKKLTQPSEMGELFKVIALTRDIDTPLRGFMIQDRRDRL